MERRQKGQRYIFLFFFHPSFFLSSPSALVIFVDREIFIKPKPHEILSIYRTKRSFKVFSATWPSDRRAKMLDSTGDARPLPPRRKLIKSTMAKRDATRR